MRFIRFRLLYCSILAAAGWAAFGPNRSIATEYPTAPEENLAIIKVSNRDAGDVARIVEDILNQSMSPEERANGVMTVDPVLNSIIVRAGGPGATWPSTVRGIVAQLDKTIDQAGLTISLWRLGWAPHVPQTPEAKTEARAVLGEQPGEKLDSYRVPIEAGTFIGAWLNCQPEAPFRVVGVTGPVASATRTAKLTPLRIEVIEPIYSGVAPGGPSSYIPGNAPISDANSSVQTQSNIPPSNEPAAPAASKESKPQATSNTKETQGKTSNEAQSEKVREGAQSGATASDTAQTGGPSGEEESGGGVMPMLPPPRGEVVFAGPISLRSGTPTVIGPFTVPDHRGQFVIAVTLTESAPHAQK